MRVLDVTCSLCCTLSLLIKKFILQDNLLSISIMMQKQHCDLTACWNRCLRLTCTTWFIASKWQPLIACTFLCPLLKVFLITLQSSSRSQRERTEMFYSCTVKSDSLDQIKKNCVNLSHLIFLVSLKLKKNCLNKVNNVVILIQKYNLNQGKFSNTMKS